MAAKLRFYLDENIPVALAVQLQRRGIEAVTVRDLGLLGDSDRNHLKRAAMMGYVLCTNDADYLDIASSGFAHVGIVFGQQHRHTIGDWVRHLELMSALYEPGDMQNHIEYL